MLPVLKYNGIEIANDIKFAKNPFSQILGLMFRKSIHNGFAMIFSMKRPSSVRVHMLFMMFPIDVIFLDRDKKITGLTRLDPWTGYRSMKNIRYVIEMKAGTIERFGLSVDSKMEFEDI